MVVRHYSQLVVRCSGLAFVVVGLVVAAWISRCLFDYAQLAYMAEAGEWTGRLGKAVALAAAMLAFGIRVLVDGHEPVVARRVTQEISLVTPELVHQVRSLVKRGRVNDALHIYRTCTGDSRSEATEAVRRLTKW